LNAEKNTIFLMFTKKPQTMHNENPSHTLSCNIFHIAEVLNHVHR
jgi:hypothetical protein